MPLHIAAENGDTATVLELIKKGAVVNQPDKDGKTPLFKAARTGHTDTVRALIKEGAVVNQADKFGRMPAYSG